MSGRIVAQLVQDVGENEIFENDGDGDGLEVVIFLLRRCIETADYIACVPVLQAARRLFHSKPIYRSWQSLGASRMKVFVDLLNCKQEE